MLRSINNLKRFAMHASDGKVGHVADFYFDDHAWTIRYFVVDTGDWLAGRQVLISPMGIGRPDWTARTLPVAITRQQVMDSPDVDTQKPVSRQYEMQYLAYYNYPFYWGGAGVWGGVGLPGSLLSGSGFEGVDAAYEATRLDSARALSIAEHDADRHLRSCNSVTGYHLHASDGDIGHVQGMLVDEDTWTIHYLIVDTSNWWLGHQVLIAVGSIVRISWPDSHVTVNLTRESVREAFPYDGTEPLPDAPVAVRQAGHPTAGAAR